MQCTDELQYLIALVNDHINTLPLSSKIAVGEKAQFCISRIEQILKLPVLPPEAETPADPTE